MTLDENGLVRLIDFGHAEVISLMTKVEKGTPRYKASEVVNGSLYSVEKHDIYSLGVTLFTVLFQAFPDFSDIDKKNPLAFQRLFHRAYKSFKPSDDKHPIEFLRLLWSCFSENPQERPSISMLHEATWIADAPSQTDDALLGEI